MSEQNQPPLHAPPDKFFKEVFSRVEVARGFFQAYLPSNLVAAIEWKSLKPEPGAFIDERLLTHTSDLLFSAQIGAAPVLLYFLFEHQSRPDRAMPFRLLGYMVHIWEQWRKQAAPAAMLPAILPVVLYQGREAWTVPRHFGDSVKLPANLEAQLRPFQPDFEYILVDIARVSTEEIRGEIALRLVLTLLKAVRTGTLPGWLEGAAPALGHLLMEAEPTRFVHSLLRYAFEADANVPSTLAQLLAKVPQENVRSSAMSIAEQLREEGLEKGRQEGRHEGRQEGLEKGQLIGRVQLCQELLHLAGSSFSELDAKSPGELEKLWRDLQGRLRERGA